MQAAQGPYFDELTVGQRFTAPAMTLTDGLAAAHQAITGDRLALMLDHRLCRAVTGGEPIAPPGLVWDVAIGQSTVVTQHVKANLFYRGLAFRRLPRLGDTLSTVTEVVALRQNRPREDRAPTGLAALRITTTDQDDRPVLDFWRCAMLPLRDPGARTGHADDLDAVGDGQLPDAGGLVHGWRLDLMPARSVALRPGEQAEVAGGDVVSAAPELARLTLNVAAVHHDALAAGGERLVYGGHVIGLALTQATRALPSLVTVVAWHSCDHLAPVREGETVRSTITVEQVDDLPGGGALAVLRSVARTDKDVLDWRYVAVLA